MRAEICELRRVDMQRGFALRGVEIVDRLRHLGGGGELERIAGEAAVHADFRRAIAHRGFEQHLLNPQRPRRDALAGGRHFAAPRPRFLGLAGEGRFQGGERFDGKVLFPEIGG